MELAIQSLYEVKQQSQSVRDLKFSRTLHDSCCDHTRGTSAIGTIERILSQMPAPKTKKKKKKKKKAEDDDDGEKKEGEDGASPEGSPAKKKKKKKKGKKKKSSLPEPAVTLYGPR